MEDFRSRRDTEARTRGQQPGLAWTSKVDGQTGHNKHSRQHTFRKSSTSILGDIGFADDTALIGEAEEVRYAEPLLETTMMDWCEKVHPGKTEGLRLQANKRQPTDVRYKGEQSHVRHVGGILQEDGGCNKDTAHKIARGYLKIRQTANAWHFGARRQQSQMPLHARVKIMKAILMPTLTCFGRTRVWHQEHIMQLQRVVNYAVRRCFNVRKPWMKAHHTNARRLCAFVGWEPFEFTIGRQSLFWLGHVARMGTHRLPKQALFGWWSQHFIQRRPMYRQEQWLNYLLAQIQVNSLDWFRLAQDRDEWKRVVLSTFPVQSLSKADIANVRRWGPGLGRPNGDEARFDRVKRKRER